MVEKLNEQESASIKGIRNAHKKQLMQLQEAWASGGVDNLASWQHKEGFLIKSLLLSNYCNQLLDEYMQWRQSINDLKALPLSVSGFGSLESVLRYSNEYKFKQLVQYKEVFKELLDPNILRDALIANIKSGQVPQVQSLVDLGATFKGLSETVRVCPLKEAMLCQSGELVDLLLKTKTVDASAAVYAWFCSPKDPWLGAKVIGHLISGRYQKVLTNFFKVDLTREEFNQLVQALDEKYQKSSIWQSVADALNENSKGAWCNEGWIRDWVKVLDEKERLLQVIAGNKRATENECHSGKPLGNQSKNKRFKL